MVTAIGSLTFGRTPDSLSLTLTTCRPSYDTELRAETRIDIVHCQCRGIGSLTFGLDSVLPTSTPMKFRPSCEMNELGDDQSFKGPLVIIGFAYK